MAVFDELNRRPERAVDPEARKAEVIKRDAPKRIVKRSSGVSVNTYRRTKTIVTVAIVALVLGIVVGGGYWAIQMFVN